MLFLRRDSSTGLWEQLNDQAAYLVEGSRILPTTRTDPMVGRIEAMTLPELERLIAEDRAEVARGELEPVPRGSTR